MDCVKMALKSSFGPEMVPKPSSQQTLFEDLATADAQTAAVSSDDLFVDDFLDFSKADTEDGFVEEEDNKVVSLQELNENDEFNSSRSKFSVPESELCVPFLQADDLADLEWVSHFVDDSFSGFALTYSAGKLPEKPSENPPEPEIPVLTKQCLTTPVQTKARSKRARTGGRVWSLGSPSMTESSATSSSASSSCTTSSPAPSLNPWLIYNDGSLTAESLLGQPPAKKKKKPAAQFGGGVAPQPRRCSHCLVQKTPQWRTGPLGAKTLCNACGVRFKSGRLLPEYRPACSPTFSSEVHSNNHRKVLEMRRKKEVETGDGLAQPVQSF